MAAQDEVIAGLDVGSTATRVVVAALHDGHLEVIGIGEAPSGGSRYGVVTNLDALVRSIELATERAERMAGTSISNVYLALGGEHVRTHSSRASVAIASDHLEITERDVGRVLAASRRIEPHDDRRILHALPRGFSLDGVNGVVDPVGLEARRLEVDAHLVSCAEPMVANLLRGVSRAGLEAVGIVYEPLAAVAATLDHDAMTAGAILLDIGASATRVALISRGRIIHTAAIPIGGERITSDLALGLRLSHNEAEEVKARFVWSLKDTVSIDLLAGGVLRSIEQGSLRAIIVARLHELIRLVCDELRKVTVHDVHVEQIVVTGGGASLSGIEEVCRELFGLPTHLGLPIVPEGLTDEIRQPQYAAVLGLLLYGPASQSRPPRSRRLSLPQRIATWIGDLWR